jgi:hypothetical protein
MTGRMESTSNQKSDAAESVGPEFDPSADLVQQAENVNPLLTQDQWSALSRVTFHELWSLGTPLLLNELVRWSRRWSLLA